MKMVDEGAEMIDIGAESTRPGAQRVDAHEQIRRLVPVVTRVCQKISSASISVDTTIAAVAKAAIEAGATIINDISAGRDDPEMFRLAAKFSTPIVLTHMQGNPQTMQRDPRYTDLFGEIKSFLIDRANTAINAGVPKGQILIDPGIGFGKTVQHNLMLLNRLQEFVATGFPVLLGASRKRFLTKICRLEMDLPISHSLTSRSSSAIERNSNLTTSSNSQVDRLVPTKDPEIQPHPLVGATCAVTTQAVTAGVQIIRVHDVKPNRQSADVAWTIKNT